LDVGAEQEQEEPGVIQVDSNVEKKHTHTRTKKNSYLAYEGVMKKRERKNDSTRGHLEKNHGVVTVIVVNLPIVQSSSLFFF
jgi:hypothetical protein